MPKFKFEMSAPLDSATTYKKIKTLLSGDNDFKKFDSNISCTFDESGKKCDIKGSQFKANLQVHDKDSKSSQIAIEVDLPLALSLFKGKIQEVLENNLKKVLT
ncbi:MAG: polyhydroxyalkanoic acid system family protein [Pseudobdellovibrio sp.]